MLKAKRILIRWLLPCGKHPTSRELKAVANEIRLELNPHPAGQMEQCTGVGRYQTDRYPAQVQANGVVPQQRTNLPFFYCTFCFRWPQFVGMDELKFAMRETGTAHPVPGRTPGSHRPAFYRVIRW